MFPLMNVSFCITQSNSAFTKEMPTIFMVVQSTRYLGWVFETMVHFLWPDLYQFFSSLNWHNKKTTRTGVSELGHILCLFNSITKEKKHKTLLFIKNVTFSAEPTNKSTSWLSKIYPFFPSNNSIVQYKDVFARRRTPLFPAFCDKKILFREKESLLDCATLLHLLPFVLTSTNKCTNA